MYSQFRDLLSHCNVKLHNSCNNNIITTYLISLNFIILTFPFHVLIFTNICENKLMKYPPFLCLGYNTLWRGRIVTTFQSISCFNFYCRYGRVEPRNERTCMSQAEVTLLIIHTRKSSFNTVDTWWLHHELVLNVTDSFVCNTSKFHAMCLFRFPIICLNSALN